MKKATKTEKNEAILRYSATGEVSYGGRRDRIVFLLNSISLVCVIVTVDRNKNTNGLSYCYDLKYQKRIHTLGNNRI
jgi:hypothetical protein